MEKVQTRWARLGGKLGMLFAGLGFLLMLMGWNGAAGLDYVQGQIPYVISGGLVGLALVIFGAVLLIIESNRRDRMLLERRLEELTVALTRQQDQPEPARRERPLRRAQ